MSRFRFSIRDLFWLTLVVALALGWFVREGHLGDRVTQAQSEMERAQGEAAAAVSEIEEKRELLEALLNKMERLFTTSEDGYYRIRRAYEPIKPLVESALGKSTD